MSPPPPSRDDPDEDPRGVRQPLRSEVPQDCQREEVELADDPAGDDTGPHGYGFGV